MYGLQNNGHKASALWRYWRIPFLIFAFLLGNACLAASGLVPTTSPLSLQSLNHVGWAVADFDGDSRPDMAVTKMEAQGAGYVYWLEFDLSTRRAGDSAQQAPGVPLAASSMFGLHLTPRDVDGDQNLDIVVTIGFERQPVAVWINDGQGGFEEGDLAAYPILRGHEDSSLAPQGRPQNNRALYDPSRRSRFGLIASALFQPVIRSDRGRFSRSGFVVSRIPSDPRSARAPPFVL